MTDAKLTGVSRSAPKLGDANADTGPAGLADAAGGGGSAQAQVILPEHRQAVQSFFKREP
jgi:hypothetical protein